MHTGQVDHLDRPHGLVRQPRTCARRSRRGSWQPAGFSPGQGVEEGGLAGVGRADQRHKRICTPPVKWPPEWPQRRSTAGFGVTFRTRVSSEPSPFQPLERRPMGCQRRCAHRGRRRCPSAGRSGRRPLDRRSARQRAHAARDRACTRARCPFPGAPRCPPRPRRCLTRTTSSSSSGTSASMRSARFDPVSSVLRRPFFPRERPSVVYRVPERQLLRLRLILNQQRERM